MGWLNRVRVRTKRNRSLWRMFLKILEGLLNISIKWYRNEYDIRLFNREVIHNDGAKLM